ncbi:hypothetical protein NL676_023168 [Syzygium grande]|nr:hypothetical protein NL676_023168 [Syzygium grande]
MSSTGPPRRAARPSPELAAHSEAEADPLISRKERDERRFVHDRSLCGAGASGPGFLSVGAGEQAAWLHLDGNRRE